MNLVTVYDTPYILDEAVNNLKGLSGRTPSFVLSESVQPLQDRFDVLLSENMLYKLDCAALSKETGQRKRTHWIVPA